jgi:predicted MFS family arabinose efflux permease
MYNNNYRLVFWLSVVPGILAVAIINFFLKDSKSSRKSSQAKLPHIGFKHLNRRFILFSLIVTVFTVGNFSDAFLALRAQNIGVLPALIPLGFLH